MTWRYETRFGSFLIHPGRDGRWNLWLGDEVLDSYHSPEEAAEAVGSGQTGFWPRDEAMLDPDGLEPTDLSDWE